MAKAKKVKEDKVVKANKALEDKMRKNLSIVAKKIEAQKYKTALLLHNGTVTKKKCKEKVKRKR